MDICNYYDCKVTDIIMKYLVPLMQFLSIDMKDYNMMLKTTKCLNTAVMLVFLLGGSEQLETAEFCDSYKINKRYKKKKNKLEYKINVLEKLKKDISSKNIHKKWFYYILLTHNDMVNGVNPTNKETAFFPGHVFIIDKYKDCRNDVKYKIYQSYINQYDLIGHYKKNKNSMKLKNNNINFLLDGLDNIIKNPLWNQNSVEFWKQLSFVDTQSLVNHKTEDINLCYSKIRIDSCYKNLLKFVKKSSKKIKKDILENNLNKYNVEQNNSDFMVKKYTIYELFDKFISLENELINELKNYNKLNK